ncbi:MAG: hypothetical protein HRT88_11340 [Lentisphaeraceae bacterium]|nr:hypothetical protein [Lentisphaeraceae bacterium]
MPEEDIPAQSVKLSGELLTQAKEHAQVEQRSIAKQIEYWAMMGRLALENPDLPFDFIRETMVAVNEQQIKAKNVDDFFDAL